MPMIEMQVGDQTIRYDREATLAAYEKIEHGWAEKCGCVWCRNFAAQRDVVYPASFRVLMKQLGIDPNKESEVDEYGPVRDEYLVHRYHTYNGWLSFVGELLTDGGRNVKAADALEFEFWIAPGLPARHAFRGGPTLAIEFKTQVKWVLPEQPEYKTTTGDILRVNESGEVVKVKPEH